MRHLIALLMVVVFTLSTFQIKGQSPRVANKRLTSKNDLFGMPNGWCLSAKGSISAGGTVSSESGRHLL